MRTSLKDIYRKSLLPLSLAAGLLGITSCEDYDPKCDEWYEQAYGCMQDGQDEIVETEEFDLDMDGKADWVFEKGYDCLDNIIAERYDFDADGKAEWNIEYDYDCDNRLHKKYYDIDGDGEWDFIQKYVYDKDGNLKKILNDWDADGDYECESPPSECDGTCPIK